MSELETDQGVMDGDDDDEEDEESQNNVGVDLSRRVLDEVRNIFYFEPRWNSYFFFLLLFFL